ncbi:D-alanyl-D-alanine carboxypeptidase family protein [Aquibacillus rhizosphaerae]|uniref:serine-type D-Ala-D-Ala carboxypeptidase n=1 Tax=Aquibacillus rhizosphaerae TaxID=3051431 RepID=A0ABT7L4G0_9BACI|nr:D-alanyl-D-alanine carboxypeptidase family protein [Aquibacillus sp. LR5S19]MDL4840753.1 D-alanyl-D-alanine carboxypeptidase family protein [Aquibacillus sp. LR5S19]
MKRLFILISLVNLLLFAFPIHLFAKPSISANNAVLIEQSTGRVLYEKQANQAQLIASITKIMTAIIAIESGKMDETVTASHRAAYTEGSSLYLKEGEKMKLRDLVYGLMLRSGNDSAVAIAEHVGGSVEGFAHLMNEKARWIGMSNSHFDNPHGLDSDKHYSTAYDMALLTKYAMENAEFREVTGSTSYKSETRTYAWGNKNKLLTRYYKYSTGGKTGYTKAAGRTLVSTAEKDGMELIVVTLNASDDWKDHMRLFEWGFDNFNLTKIQEIGKESYQIKNTENTVEGYLRNEIIVPLTNEEKKELDTTTYVDQNSFENSEVIGRKVYSLEGNEIAETKIYTDKKEEKKNNEEKGFLQEIVNIFNRIVGVS